MPWRPIVRCSASSALLGGPGGPASCSAGDSSGTSDDPHKSAIWKCETVFA